MFYFHNLWYYFIIISAVIVLQIIRMNIERFSIPELLFHPSDIGIQEMGVAEAVVHTISQTPAGSCNVSPARMRVA